MRKINPSVILQVSKDKTLGHEKNIVSLHITSMRCTIYTIFLNFNKLENQKT